MEYTQTDVDKILEAAKKASPAPWRWDKYGNEFICSYLVDCNGLDVHIDEEHNSYSADLMAGAPILASEVERMRVEIDRLHGDIDIAYSQGYNDGYLDGTTEDCEE